MRAAIIKNGKVFSIVEVPNLQSDHFVLVPEQPGMQAGDDWNGTIATRPSVEAPDLITATQARFALIDANEEDNFNIALAAVTPARKKRRVNAEWATAHSFDRKGSAFTFVLNQMGWTKKQIDDIFIAAAALDPIA